MFRYSCHVALATVLVRVPVFVSAILTFTRFLEIFAIMLLMNWIRQLLTKLLVEILEPDLAALKFL